MNALIYETYETASFNRAQGIIYQLRNKHTDEIYVGATSRSLRTRWKQHRKAKNRHNSPLYQSLRLFGSEVFEVECIASCLDVNELAALEAEIIGQRQPTLNTMFHEDDHWSEM